MTMDVRDMTSPEQLMGHIQHIAQWVRLSGSPEESKGFDYIEEKLTEWKISYKRITHPAYISLPGKASVTIKMQGIEMPIECITHAMGANTPKEGIAGSLVYVGKGMPDDYKHFPQGAIALVEGLATPLSTLNAGKANAAGVVFINGSEFHEMIVSPVWGSPPSDRQHLLPEIPVVSILEKDARKIKSQLAQQIPVQVTLNTEVLTEWREIPLLIADIEGNQYPEEVVMLAGHVDSWHYGAMDNASANAVQLEALRVFQQRKDKLVRSLRVAFWSGHSHGRYAGSTWYVDEHWAELEEELVVQMYVDSVGGKGATVLSQAWAMSETKPVAIEALALETGEVFEGGRFGRGGDQSFYGIGVSGLFMCLSEQPPITDPKYIGSSNLLGGNGKTGGLGSWWHAVDDTVDKLDPAFLNRDARIYLYSLSRYLEEPRLALDFRETIMELRNHLLQWQKIAQDRFELSEAVKYCNQLEEVVQPFYQAQDLEPTIFNQIVITLGRILIPLNYTTGNKYEQDLALNYQPIPSLEPIQDLLKTEPGSDEEQHLLILLKRRLNYVSNTLRKASQYLKEFPAVKQIPESMEMRK
ncbi:M28 family peptidase [Neobacillus muris]|uniref:M28 family peptidase n=1 Tax=Neobacillus muris TaxID=2941334 RepID=UPI00203DFA32|nr:M28 family peptidase [Neobacillus muris]